MASLLLSPYEIIVAFAVSIFVGFALGLWLAGRVG